MNIKLVIIIVLSIVYGLFELIMGLYQKRQKETVKSYHWNNVGLLAFRIINDYTRICRLCLSDKSGGAFYDGAIRTELFGLSKTNKEADTNDLLKKLDQLNSPAFLALKNYQHEP